MVSPVKNHIVTTVLLMLVSFYFLSVDVLADKAAASLPDSNILFPLHVAYLFVMAGGFLIFSMTYRPAEKAGKATAVMTAVCAAGLASMFGFILIHVQWAFIACVMICLFTAGMIGAGIYYYSAMALKGSGCTGRVCGIGIGGAAVLQIVLISVSLPLMVEAVVLTAALAAAGCILMTHEKAGTSKCSSGNGNIKKTGKPADRTVMFMILTVAVISVMGGINDGVLSMMNAEGDLELYSFPRLFFLVGVVAAGYIADYKNRRYLPISILVIMLCAVVGIMFMNNTATLNINACIYSLFAGFAIIYFTVPFFDMAAVSRDPALWAGMGRVVRLIFLALGTVLMEAVLKDLAFTVTIIVFVILAVVLVLLLWAAGMLMPPGRQTAGHRDIGSFCRDHGFTKREIEIFSMVYNGASTAEAAEKLFLSEKTVRNHISNMLAKTETRSRAEMFALAGREG